MGQINIGKQNVHNTPPSGACAYTFNADGKPGYVDSSGVFTLLGESGTSTTNLYASLGVGLSSALPESPEIGDTFVTTDTLQLYTRIDSVSWSFVDLPAQAFVTDNTGDRAVLYQRIGTVLVVISSDTYDSITINGDIAVGGTVDGRDVAEDGEKLDGIEEGAQANVNADWDATTGDSEILNKPTDITDLSTHASSELSDGSDLVKGPASATDNAIARFDGTTGKLVQDSGVYIDDSGNLVMSKTSSTISTDTTDGADNKRMQIVGGGGTGSTRGGYIEFYGNEYAGAEGDVRILAGDASQGNIRFYTGAYSERMRIAKGGNVGISTNNPSEKLHVIGNILASQDSASRTKTIANKVRMEYNTSTDTLEFNFI